MGKMTIGKPGKMSGFKATDHIGDLVVFLGVSRESNVKTAFGETDAARVQLVVPLDGEHGGEVFTDSLIFGRALVPSLVNAGADIVVGRLAQGEAKKGQSAPTILADPTDEEVEAVQEWIEANIEEDRGRYLIAEQSFGDEEG